MVMGLLVDGVWQQDSAGKEFGSRTEGGHFIRRPTVFHNYVTADGTPGPTGIGGFDGCVDDAGELQDGDAEDSPPDALT
jgi:glutathionyl-hydroquinone reductase